MLSNIRRSNESILTDAAGPRDVGEQPGYRNANALISTDFRYFGGGGTDEWKDSAPELKQLIDGGSAKMRVLDIRTNEEEFDAVADTFRNSRVWRIEDGQWVKDNIWGGSSAYGSVHAIPASMSS